MGHVGLYTKTQWVYASEIVAGDVIYTGSEWRTVACPLSDSSLAIELEPEAYYVAEGRRERVQRVAKQADGIMGPQTK